VLFRSIEGDLRLAGLTARARSILEVTRLDRIFQIYPQAAQAVASFND
jgi:anti-anti-sigma regulatory factor